MTIRALSAAFILSASIAAPASGQIGPSPLSAPDGSVMAAWTQITGNGSKQGDLTGLVRVALAGTGGQTACDSYNLQVLGDATAPTPALKARQNAVPSKFPVTVCEAPADPKWNTIVLTTGGKKAPLWLPDGAAGPYASFPTLHAVGRRNGGQIQMVTVGDTGCRDNSQQSCTSSATWPFGTLSDAAAAQTPDFVLHVGDYRYSHKGHSDSWKYWYEEFFYPARNLLLTSPWVMVRGNHEACGYDNPTPVDAPWGTGWFYFLQHHDAANSLSCPADSTESTPDPTAYQPPWYFDVGVIGGGTLRAPHRIIVMDSSTDTPSSKQVANFTTMLGDTAATNSAWWTGHRPIWGINPYSPVSALEANLEQDLTTALKSFSQGTPCWADSNLPCSLRTMIAGHIHNLERVLFFGTGSKSQSWIRPMQYVSGNSGVVLTPPMQASPCAFKVPQYSPSTFGPNLAATVDWQNAFGFTLWERDPLTQELSGWKETRYLLDGGTVVPSSPPSITGTVTSPTC